VVHLSVHFADGFGAGYGDALGVDNNNIVAHFHAWRERRFMLSEQDGRNTRGKAPKGFTVGIYHKPLALDLTR
jgi:hypothetical protein